MDYDEPEELRKDIARSLRDGEELDIDLDSDKLLNQLFNAAIACRKEFNWSKARILNKNKEFVKFKKAWDKEKKYEPQFRFKAFNYDRKDAIEILNQFETEAGKIDRKLVADLGLKHMDHKDLRELFRGIFEEYKLYIQVRANIANTSEWRKSCRKIWHFNKKTVQRANQRLQNREFNEEDKEYDKLDAADVSAMWKAEIKRHGMEDYKIEIRNVSGCHNIPEERKLVVAAGENSEREYSLDEAKILTVHEIFHAARCYNGYEVTRNSDMPPILGVHTPFYDRTEEGGAVFREFKTEKITDWKEKDYYLRTMAAHHWNQGLSFSESVQKLINLGATLKRAYALASRNREVMRHQVYLGGLMEWENLDSPEKMMCGKVNLKWAEKIWHEINSEGPFEKPGVTYNQMFQSNEFAFDI